jgi:hypothetical protein
MCISNIDSFFTRDKSIRYYELIRIRLGANGMIGYLHVNAKVHQSSLNKCAAYFSVSYGAKRTNSASNLTITYVEVAIGEKFD